MTSPETESKRIRKWWSRQFGEAELSEGFNDWPRSSLVEEEEGEEKEGEEEEAEKRKSQWFESLSNEEHENKGNGTQRRNEHTQIDMRGIDISQALTEKTDQIMESLTQEDVESLPHLEKPFKDIIQLKIKGGNGGWYLRGQVR